MAYGCAITGDRMTPSAHRSFNRRQGRTSEHRQACRPGGGDGQRDPIAQRQVDVVERGACGEHVLEIALSGERAVDPRPRQPEFARFVQKMRERPAISGNDDGVRPPGDRPEAGRPLSLEHAAVPEPHGHRQACKAAVGDVAQRALRRRSNVPTASPRSG